MKSSRWTTVQESEFPWERDALSYVRTLLPDTEPFRAWSNFEFVAQDGSINEVDLLVISLYRIYLVEIKSAPGQIEGDAGTWTWTREDGRVHRMDNPLLLANRKAKKLKSLLAAQHAFKNRRVPYIEAAVFLSNADVSIGGLSSRARTGIYLRKETSPRGDPHIGQVLTGKYDLQGGHHVSTSRIDHLQARATVRALEQAGIRRAQRYRQVGDYRLERLLVETDVYQDWEAKHAQFEKSHRRVRIYPIALQSSETTRAERRRAAEREYRLLDGVVHDGILRVEGFTDHERGPALIFEHPAGAERFDFFLQHRLKNLDIHQRLALVRQVAETLQFAHARRLYHQSLTPQSVLVCDPESDKPTLKLFNWQAGRSEVTTEGGTRLTVDNIVKVGLAGEQEGAVYLAPELYIAGVLDPARLDVFSLGALTYHTLSGVAPAATVEELHDKLTRDDGGLHLSEVFDGATEDLEMLVQFATEPDTSERSDIAEFLMLLDQVLAELAKPDPSAFTHPLDANEGDELEGGFVVRRRLGKGATAVALLVERDGREGVLKVALEPSLNDRIQQEGEVLGTLRHQNIVELYEAIEVSGHGALFMQAAGTRSGSDGVGTYTLAQRIREEGRLSLDLLQRFGEELLGVVDWLEQKGISHRDIKPDNIGIGETPGRKLTLVLFDFSLSGVPADNIRAGTPPYLDPFIVLRKPPRWDAYAERFGAAVTLYEMATGQLPAWGDGMSNPAMLDVEVSLDVELFDTAVRDGLEGFFRKALARDYRERFDNAEEMRRSWARVFEQIDEPTRTSDTEGVDLSAALEEATESTPVATLPLSPRVLNALERMGVNTLRELQELPRIRLYRNKGIGQRTVKEVRRLAEKVAEHLAGLAAEPALAELDASVEPRYWSIDLMRRRLLPKHPEEDDVVILEGLLGLAPMRGREPAWPSQQDVAEGLGYTRETIRAVIERERERWRKDRPNWMLTLRDDVATLLDKHGGVMTRRELVGALLAARGSAAPEADRFRCASAVAYAALEVEASRTGARYILYRGRHHLYVVATPELGEAFVATPAARARYAEALGAKADELAEADPLLSPERALDEVLAVASPEGERPLPPERLLRLAVAASEGAALSSRLEVYPRGMLAARALKLAAGSLLGPKKLSPEMVQTRVASRYPDAEPLPGRPALDALLEEAGLHLSWSAEEGMYTSPEPRFHVSSSSSLTRYTTTGTSSLGSLPPHDALMLEQRLAAVAPGRRLLVLTVSPREHQAAEQELTGRFDLERVNLESLLLDAMRATTEDLKARWEVVLGADAAAPGSRDWRNLQHVVDRAVAKVEEALLALERPGLLVYPGLLARYDRLDLFDRLRQACADGTAPGYVLLVPADAQTTMPVIDRVPLPVVHASDWARIPRAWTQNRHRGRAHADTPSA